MPDQLPRLAWPFTILTSSDTVRLVAGEDFRYTLTGPALELWLPDWLKGLDGRTSLDQAFSRVPDQHRSAARQIAERLYGERVLINGTAADVHLANTYRLEIAGNASWATQPLAADAAGRPLPTLCQDRLDYDEALRFNRRCLDSATTWLWATTGPMSRAYVSPLFLPNAGPCASCLLYHFRRLSPAPELYEALIVHARQGKPIESVPFPEPAIAVVWQLLLWKATLAAETVPNAALYRLHVLELATLEVTAHRVWVDPECPECGSKK